MMMFKQLRIFQIIDVVVGLDVDQIEERENQIGRSEKTRSVTVVVVLVAVVGGLVAAYPPSGSLSLSLSLGSSLSRFGFLHV
jgi:hypothetical protein